MNREILFRAKSIQTVGDESGDSYSWLEYRENPDLTIIGNIYDNSELLNA